MSTVLAHDDYRAILREEFSRRCRNNPRYSQGAFARDIKLRPSRLSEVLSGKQGLSAKTASDIARCLGFSEIERNYFSDLVLRDHARSRTRRETAALRLRSYRSGMSNHELREDAFKVIADWYHLALVELTKIDGFQSDPLWIGEALGITPAEAQVAIERLVRLNLLRFQHGALSATFPTNLVTSDAPSAPIRDFHEQILTKACRALSEQLPDQRSHHSYIVAVDKSRIPELQRRLLAVAREFDEEMEGTGGRNAVYCLATQLFELTVTPRASSVDPGWCEGKEAVVAES